MMDKQCRYKGKSYLPGERVFDDGKTLECQKDGNWQEQKEVLPDLSRVFQSFETTSVNFPNYLDHNLEFENYE